MLREQVFSDRSNYPKVSETSTPIDAVEWFAKNKGITDLNKPGAKVRSIINDVNESELARYEAKKARESKAQDEFLDAMFNLDSGTAVLRQKNDRTKPVVKKVKVAKKAAKAAKKVVKPAKRVKPVAVKAIKVAKAVKVKPIKESKVPKYRHKLGRKIPSSQKAAKARREIMLTEFAADRMVRMLPQHRTAGELHIYQQQQTDITHIRRNAGLSIVRLCCYQTGKSFYTVDKFVRHEMEPISGLLIGEGRKTLFKAICSGEMVAVTSITGGAKVGASTMTQLARRHGFKVHAVIKGAFIQGWVLIEEGVKAGTLDVKEGQ